MKNLKSINWNQLYYFYEVARKLSIKEAAPVLNLSSATISEQIKKLELSLSLELFNRSSRKLTLTRDGENLFLYAKEIFETGRRLLDSISQNSIGGYPVRVGVQDTLSTFKALGFVSEYSDLYAPFGTVHTLRDYDPDRMVDSLLRGELDWAVLLNKPNAKSLVSKKIATINVSFCVSKKLYQKFKKKEDLFKTIPLTLSNWDKVLYTKVRTYLNDHRIIPEEIIESDYREYCLMLAERGRCIMPVEKGSLKGHNWTKNMAIFDLGKTIEISLYAAWRKQTEKMISIQKLKQLITMSDKPINYHDPELLIKIAQIPKDKLK